jgi:hypothetical protein
MPFGRFTSCSVRWRPRSNSSTQRSVVASILLNVRDIADRGTIDTVLRSLYNSVGFCVLGNLCLRSSGSPVAAQGEVR